MSTDWKEAAARAKAQLANIKEEQRETMAVALDMVATNGAAGLLGYLFGRKAGMPTLAGVPYDLLGAGLASIFGFWGVSKGASWGRPVVAFGSGCSSIYLFTKMSEIGQKKREEAGESFSVNEGVMRELTTDEAREAGVQPRRPVLAGARRSLGAGIGLGNAARMVGAYG